MTNDFDRLINRQDSESIKWHHYDPDVLPMWVADLDFLSPEPVIRALRDRVDHGVFGYGAEPPELRPAIVDRLAQRYGWHISPEDLVFLPGVVTGFNLACQAVIEPGNEMLVQTPVYPPILHASKNAGLVRNDAELTRGPDGCYSIDFEAFEESITNKTRIFVLCNPHNPVGRAFGREELERMAQICLRRNVVICSDEIHCDLLFKGQDHIPVASLDRRIAEQTITLMAPSKTYNIAGLHCSFAVIQNPDLRESFRASRRGLVPHVTLMGFVAALAAYQSGQAWLDEVLLYLESNRNLVLDFVESQMRGVHMGQPEASYLAWLDCRETNIQGNPCQFFLQNAKVATNDGSDFGRGGEGFVRFNFGCSQSLLLEALEKMRAALTRLE